jgi:hypothetical protein
MFRPRRAEGNRLPRLRKNSQVRPAGRSSVIRTLLNHRIAAKAKGRNAARRLGGAGPRRALPRKIRGIYAKPQRRRGLNSYRSLYHTIRLVRVHGGIAWDGDTNRKDQSLSTAFNPFDGFEETFRGRSRRCWPRGEAWIAPTPMYYSDGYGRCVGILISPRATASLNALVRCILTTRTL